MAKNQQTFRKRQRERALREKAQQKRARRQQRREQKNLDPDQVGPPLARPSPESEEGANPADERQDEATDSRESEP